MIVLVGCAPVQQLQQEQFLDAFGSAQLLACNTATCQVSATFAYFSITLANAVRVFYFD